MKHSKLMILAAIASVACSTVRADVKPAAPFADHMVLQREHVDPVWGTADAGEAITVEFGGQKKNATADDRGRWFVKLDAVPTSETPAELKISGKNKVIIKDVLVGDVWVASGQSNMGFALARASTAKEAIESSADPLLRWCHGGGGSPGEPQSAIPSTTTWKSVDPSNAPTCSAAAYFFAREIRRTQKIPIGILQSAVGGTAAEQWTEMSFIKSQPELKDLFAGEEAKQKEWESGKAKADYEKSLARYTEQAAKAKAEGKPAPRKPREPADPTKSHFVSGLFNGHIAPLEPFAIRGVIWYQGESNGSRGKQYRVLFPTMIDCWRATWAKPPALAGEDLGIAREDFPFIFVQLPNFRSTGPKDTGYAELRDAQLFTLKTVPNTGMAIAIDVGEDGNIHPVNKQPVGERLAIAARAMVYGEKVEPTGPVFDSIKIDGDKAVVTFTHVGGGLESKTGETLKGFTIAGPDNTFVAASAHIEGNTVVVSSPDVKSPVAVRYAFQNVPEVSLFSKEGLPASPFRSDAK